MPEYELPLKERKEVANETMMFIFNISGIDISFKAGQYFDFIIKNMVETDEKGNRRSFSITSSPNNKEEFIITSRMRDSAFKKTLKQMELGTEVKAMGPMGSLVLPEDTSRPVVFLTGGIGITPMLSMIRYSSENKTGHKITLFYSNKTLADTAFHKELEELAKQDSDFTFVPTLTREEPDAWRYETGHFTKEMMEKYLDNLEEPVYYVTGPPGLVKVVRDFLTDSGVSNDQIKTEEFTGY